MLGIWAEEVFSIGTVAGVLQPVVVNAKLRNVPEEGTYNWDPGAFFGIYKPDGFWFDTSEMRAKSASLGAARPVQPHPGPVKDSAQSSVRE
jgi:peptide/nickel transport system substrate-binding protein